MIGAHKLYSMKKVKFRTLHIFIQKSDSDSFKYFNKLTQRLLVWIPVQNVILNLTKGLEKETKIFQPLKQIKHFFYTQT